MGDTLMKLKTTDYDKLFELSRKTTVLGSIQGLLGWDQQTYMPPKGASARAEQMAFMSHLIHKEKTGKKFRDALTKLIDLETGECFDEALTFPQRTALREWRRDYLQQVKLPSSFVKKFSQTTALATQVWKEAKEKSDFKLFAPHLQKIITLVRKKADYLGYQNHPYDALVDLYEPEMTTDHLTNLFGKLRLELSTLLKKINACPEPRTDFLRKKYPPTRQLQFGKQLLKAMGFSSDTSRVDKTAHPFCRTLSPGDLRMTTWVYPENLPTHLFAILHEGGHGLYEQNLPAAHFGSPLGQAVSLGIHESQSRLWEVFIGQSLSFWKHFYPLLQQAFPENLSAISLEVFYHAINRIKPSLIRVEADEVTYCLHIILRFEIEKALLEGHLTVKEIPDVWNEKMRTYLGITPHSHYEGCLQDIHWAYGSLGYFPTYALGNLYAAQLFAGFDKAIPTWKDDVSNGNLPSITHYLTEKIYKWGRQYPPEKLIERATGAPLTIAPYIAYLKTKFSAVYRFEQD